MLDLKDFAGCSGREANASRFLCRPAPRETAMNVSSADSLPVQEQETSDSPQRIVPVRRRVDGGHALAPSGETDPEDGVPLGIAEDADPEIVVPLLELQDIDQPSPELLAAAAGETLEAQREHLQLQVGQLAAHLRERLREIDRREGQINAEVAQLESDLRAGGLWLREREAQFQQRESELVERIAELECRLSEAAEQQRAGEELESQRAVLNESEQRLALREQELDEREQELALREHECACQARESAERRFELQRQADDLRAAQESWEARCVEQQQDLASQREQLEQSTQTVANDVRRLAESQVELRAAESLLQHRLQQVARDETELALEREAWAQRKADQQRAFDRRQQEIESQLDDRRLRLEARQEWIERQKAGLEQVRGEILALHRQSLEMRLLAEQLWSQITGRLTPAEVTQSIAQLKLKLTQQYRLEEESLEARKGELTALGERIAAQYEELSQLRSGLRQWAAARQAEIEEQAAALVERELALDEQHDELRRERQQWHAQSWEAPAPSPELNDRSTALRSGC
jgi:hypothetical protein